MSQLLETIRILKGQAQNLSEHEIRVSRSQQVLDGERSLPAIIDIIKGKKAPETGLYKARLVYDKDTYTLEYHKYKKQEIYELAIVRNDSLLYDHKYADRTKLNELRRALPEFTEALIVIRDQIKETTYTNIALQKNQQWFTPETPVLRGTMRAKLINEKIITPLDIRIEDLKDYSFIRLFNSMMPWDEAIEFPVEKIRNEKN